MAADSSAGSRDALAEAGEASARCCVGLLPVDDDRHRPYHGGEARCAEATRGRDLVLFNEYFSADTSRSVGASHQTGWTALLPTIVENKSRPYSDAFWTMVAVDSAAAAGQCGSDVVTR